MHITSTPAFRRACAITGVLAWVASVAIVGAVAVIGKHYALHISLLLCLAVAITATITGLVGDSLAPVEATYRHVYNAGLHDGIRQGRPVVVPESRMAEKREVKLDAS